jgi:hypothetical protein
MRSSNGRVAGFCLAALLALLSAGAPRVVHASAPPGTSCPVFPADNVWNTDISNLPVNSHSAAWLSSTGATTGKLLHPDFGGPPYGIPFNVVSSSHATANFNFLYWQESDPTVTTQQPQGPYPYGSDLVVEGPTDSHLLSINKDMCKLYEIGGTDYNGPHTGWSGAIFDLNSNALRPDTWTSADAAGLPIFPGLVRLDEVQARAITHAIRFTVQQSDKSHLWPARHDAGSASNPNLPPMGARFRLKTGFDISSFNAQTQVVLTAMKHYGLIVADNGSNWYFQGTMDSGWNNEPYATMVSQLKTVPASAFEAVDESSLIVDPNSGQAVPHPPCSSASLAPSNPSVPAGSTVNFTATSGGCLNPQYEYWVGYPNGAWMLARSWGGGAYSWNTAGLAPASYTVHVWANQIGDPISTWEAYGSSTVTLTGCSSASLSPPSVAQPAGTTVNLTASSSGCPNPLYEFWIGYPNGSWSVAQGWGGAAFPWNTSGLAPGTYLVHVWANQQGAPNTTWEAYGSSSVALSVCTSAALAPTNPSAAAGTAVNLTASSTGCASPQYELWVQYPNGSWHVGRGWGGAAVSWSTVGLGPGTYNLHVWANNQGDPMASWEAYGSDTVTLSGCTSASLAPPSGSATVGTKVTFTASSSGCPSPIYEFWLQDPGGTWHPMQTFVPGGATWQWNSAGWPKGNYVIHVWANNSGADTSTWETYGTATYTLT